MFIIVALGAWNGFLLVAIFLTEDHAADFGENEAR